MVGMPALRSPDSWHMGVRGVGASVGTADVARAEKTSWAAAASAEKEEEASVMMQGGAAALDDASVLGPATAPPEAEHDDDSPAGDANSLPALSGEPGEL
jgi:hypothetical protein